MEVIQKTKIEKAENTAAATKKVFKVYGIPLPLFLLTAVVTIAASFFDVLPGSIVGALAICFALGIIFGEIGDRIPIWNEYVGGGAILTFLAVAYLVYSGVMPEKTVETITVFMDDTNFLALFISVLITGSILAVNRKLLLKALVGYVPAILAGIAGAMAFGALAGLLTGIPIPKILAMYVLPIMGGGTGAGAIPMSEIYANVTGNDPKQFLSFAFPILTIANIICIVVAALLHKLGERIPALSGNGELVRGKGLDASEEAPNVKVTLKEVGAGLLLSTFFYVLGTLMSKKVLPTIGGVQVHAFAYMVVFVAIFNALNLIPEELKQGTKKLQGFFSGQFLLVIMVGVGVAYTDLGEIIQALNLQNIFIASLIVVGATLGSGLFGYLIGFFPIEASITAGLCMANRGGSGDLEVLSASKRMNLLSFAQISSRLGGGIMLVVASIVFGMVF
ncbi:CCS family citrate carrier protein [Anaerosolibacter carboniphilus]|uniref:CCS family citrate carrier protein n=1 Tax=Anaerosolibacter carboniphilus TaxID=1417629 RepID=A0A841KP51_9FIRM|nr:2-hydroxycarboxylate transporter family protein [Anaerosolibacter carboniphilus]MBB6215236.1 CCS family citrate carrier protein [Anaerosolibacter carboniphilus]